MAENPFPDGGPSLVTVAFLTKAAPAEARRRVAEIATDHEPYAFSGQEVYVHYSQGQGRSKLSAKFSDVIGVSATVRNLRTVTRCWSWSSATSSACAETALNARRSGPSIIGQA